MLTIEDLNRMSQTAFVETLGGVFEHSPWVAEQAWEARPFAGIDALHRAMVDAVGRATPASLIALLRAHPDLAGTAARAGAMTASSHAEQSFAGLDRLTGAERERFHGLNTAYRERFDFPFIIAVRRHDTASILAAFETRLGHSREQEIDAALAEVFDITRMRLEGLLDVMSRASGTDSTLRFIAALKLLKGLLLLAVAVGALRLLHHDVADVAAGWIGQLHLDPDGRVVEPLLGRLAGVDDRTLKHIGAGSLFYAVLLLTEGVGLMRGKTWAEYLTIVATSSFVPIEIYEIVRRTTATRVGVLAVNLVIVGYLVVRVRRERVAVRRGVRPGPS